ncbi:hypothetical protein CYMTET_50873 [Cymbomonas tetramitiformis]|uniref:CoA carboxyltransferase C-terminal domain-containing protein n=1 Tax=Cymbomonas tetramitiformis TaxID=36881 RepID=A0AAE0BNY0_9CHLO|nr:hypothetical protein CYMTET_50873 [Cymbomonas tetramitiformis]
MATHFQVDTGGSPAAYLQRLRETPLFKTKVELNSDEYAANYQEMEKKVAELNERLDETLWPGPQKAVNKHVAEGMLLARERMELVLDDDSPFVELCALAGWGMKVRDLRQQSHHQGRRLQRGSSLRYSLRGDHLPRSRIPLEARHPFHIHRLRLQHCRRCLPAGYERLHRAGEGAGCGVPGGPPTEMHAKVSGVADYLAMDEKHALLLTRQIVASLNHQKVTPLPEAYLAGVVEPPMYPPAELLGIASADVRVPYDAKEVIARLVDGSRFNEFKPLYGPGLVTAFAFICGFPVGILANNGVLFNAESNKGTQFIHLCNQRKTPIIFLANITGFMVGQKYEREGMIKQGALMINAVTNSAVPAITIQMGASYGAGNYAMSGRAYKPRFIFAWPQSKCSVMGPDQLTGVMEMVQRQSAINAGKKIDESVFEKSRAMLRAQVENEGNVYYTSSRLIDDGIIDPRDTRDVLAVCLSAIYSGEAARALIAYPCSVPNPITVS